MPGTAAITSAPNAQLTDGGPPVTPELPGRSDGPTFGAAPGSAMRCCSTDRLPKRGLIRSHFHTAAVEMVDAPQTTTTTTSIINMAMSPFQFARNTPKIRMRAVATQMPTVPTAFAVDSLIKKGSRSPPNDCRQALRAPGSGQTEWRKPELPARNCSACPAQFSQYSKWGRWSLFQVTAVFVGLKRSLAFIAATCPSQNKTFKFFPCCGGWMSHG
jgi:hypothetical protein